MKLILQFSVILSIVAINTAVYDDRGHYLSLIADLEKEPDILRAKFHKKSVILHSSTENKNVKSVMKQVSYKDVMPMQPMNTKDKQILSMKEIIGLYSNTNYKYKPKSHKGLVIPHDSDHNMVATPNPTKELWKEIIPLQQTVKKQYKNQPHQYFKKPSKEFRFGQPNQILVEIKPKYRDNRNMVNPAEKNEYYQDIIDSKIKAKVIIRAKEHSQEQDDIKKIDRVADLERRKKRFKMDSAMNLLKKVRRRAGSDSSAVSSSSSDEIGKWKEQFKEQYMKKKYEALNASRPAGDVVNMVAARPWGVPCGDPNQHDMPWGTCMLHAECEPEYRIFRGDNFCGRSEFVCCSIQLNDYDMYQGFDISFDSKSLSTDSEDKKKNDKDSKTKRKKRKERDRKKRKKERLKRIAKIKKNINKIVKEMKKLLDKQFKNGTKQRKQKTRLLKKFIKKLKKQYKKDREAVADIHEEEMIRIDAALQRKLNELMEMNKNFVKNETFREIVVNGAMNKKGARMLLEAYPDLDPYLYKALRKSRRTRKSGGTSENHFGENMDYNLEYGYLYFEE